MRAWFVVFVVNCVSRVHPFLKDESIQQSLVQLRKIVTPIQFKPIKYEIYSKYFYMTLFYYLKSVQKFLLECSKPICKQCIIRSASAKRGICWGSPLYWILCIFSIVRKYQLNCFLFAITLNAHTGSAAIEIVNTIDERRSKIVSFRLPFVYDMINGNRKHCI